METRQCTPIYMYVILIAKIWSNMNAIDCEVGGLRLVHTHANEKKRISR